VLTGVAAPLLTANIDTDVLIRVERMLDLVRGQFGPYCFESWRTRPDGSDDPSFVLNEQRYRTASILLAGANFGCGSSREPAVWALWDMGFRCVIAPSFGGIFFDNCFQNGMLPLVLPAELISELAEEADGSNGFTIDLFQQSITTPKGKTLTFAIDAARRRTLLEGRDEISMTLDRDAEITAFQDRDRIGRPWIWTLSEQETDSAP